MKFNCGPEWEERIITIKPAKKIGVLVSSGLDSTTLLSLLYNNFDSEIKLYNVRTGINTDKPVIRDILSKLGIDLTLNIVGNSIWQTPMYNHHARLWKAFQEIKELGEIDELYCGNIQSPREAFFPDFKVSSPEFPKRPWLTKDSFLKNPFEHLEKYHVIDLGRRLGIDHIYNTTISCNVYELWHCGKCMGCKELLWGFSQLDNPTSTSLADLVAKATLDLTTDTTKNHDKEYWNL